MKISDATRTGSTRRAGAASSSSPAAETRPTQIVDKLSIAGIPAEELTPRVRAAISQLMEDVQQLRSKLDETQERLAELEKLADTDPLLGVPNRRAFVRDVSKAIALAERYEASSALIFIDVNDLKKINDEKGHAAGDAALAHVARMLSENIRQSDSMGRIGGDEFGVLLVMTTKEAAQEKAAALSRLVGETPVEWNGETFPARISCGAVEIAKGANIDEAMHAADSAMYKVKRGR